MIGNPMDTPKTTHPPDPRPAFVEDVEILAEIAQGNLDRFDILVNRYKVRLMSYLGHRVPDRHHTEDLVQEAFLRLFRAARNGGYSGQASVCTWLFTIAENCATDYLRASGRQPLMLESDTAGRNDDDSSSRLDRRSSPDPDPAEAAARRESQGRAEALLDCLPEEQRRVVALKVLGGLTLAEIATVVGCPIGTAKSRLLYGLRKIEASIAPLGRRNHDQ
ncbi:MAG: RNA polymerase sigma factor [Thermoguttaceae bacterium]